VSRLRAGSIVAPARSQNTLQLTHNDVLVATGVRDLIVQAGLVGLVINSIPCLACRRHFRTFRASCRLFPSVVGRRLRMILVAYRSVFDTIAPDRKEPLPLNEMAAVSRDLNIIYINICGALDNYA
jgi:hypothetical protein